MSLQFGGTPIGAMQYNGVTIGEAMYNGQIVYRSALPVVYITGTSGFESRDQFRAACTQYGTNYQTVQELPFYLDTSQATDLNAMFRECYALTTVPDLDTSQATNLLMLFYRCSVLTTVPDLDTSQATSMSSMFRDCYALTTVPELDTSKATSMSYMFGTCSALTTVPDLVTSQATNLSYMFRDCSSLTDGNVRCIGKHPSANTANMITGSGLTREPFYDTNGNPI